MTCANCDNSPEGYAVLPGIGPTGEIRFYCDSCARRDRVKMRYWDGRDLEVGGWRENPDLGDHFHTLIFTFEDYGRVRRQDLIPIFEWADDENLAAALTGTDAPLQRHILEALPRARAAKIRVKLKRRRTTREIEEGRKKLANLVRRI